jgi:hypothetical protein
VRIFRHLSLCLLLVLPVLSAAQEGQQPKQKAQKRLSGVWKGTYHYPEGSEMKPVNFQLVLIQDGSTVAGFIKEPNTFGKRNEEPWLHATFKGTFDAKEGKLTFTKTYDGTSGIEHDVEYKGKLSQDRKKVEGMWELGNDASGRFTLERLTLDAATLDNLKKGPAKD